MRRLIVDFKGKYPGKSKAAQLHAFDLGWTWALTGKGEFQKSTDTYSFICLFSNYDLSFGSNEFNPDSVTYCNETKVVSLDQFLEMSKKDVLSFLKPIPTYESVRRFLPVYEDLSVGRESYKTIDEALEEKSDSNTVIGYFPITFFVDSDYIE